MDPQDHVTSCVPDIHIRVCSKVLRSWVIFFAVFDVAADFSESMVLRATIIVLSTSI